MSNSLQPYGPQPARFLCPWGFSRQEFWSGLPCPPPGDLPIFPTQGSNLCPLCLQHWQVGPLPLVPPAVCQLYLNKTGGQKGRFLTRRSCKLETNEVTSLSTGRKKKQKLILSIYTEFYTHTKQLSKNKSKIFSDKQNLEDSLSEKLKFKTHQRKFFRQKDTDVDKSTQTNKGCKEHICR